MDQLRQKKQVMIVAHYASYGGAGELAKEFRRRPDWECKFVITRRDESQEFWKEYDAIYWPEQNQEQREALSKFLHSASATFVAGSPGLDLWTRIINASESNRNSFDARELDHESQKLTDFCRDRPTALFVTDSQLLKDPEFWNQIYGRLKGLNIFAMPDLSPYIKTTTALRPYFPPIEVAEAYVPPEERPPILIGHSPSKPEREHQKGTNFVRDAVSERHVPFELITKMTRREAVNRKARLTIFVDQIPEKLFPKTNWHGGLGKSGLEALALGIPVLCGGVVDDTQPYFPMPPVTWVSRSTFGAELDKFLDAPEHARRLGRQSKEWADRYVKPAVIADYVLGHIGAAKR